MNISINNKTIVLIISAMRSGSTLLKALLATAKDVSDLPEINFKDYCCPDTFQNIFSLSEKNIIVLKHPAWFAEIKKYPVIPPFNNIKKIVMVRDVHDTVTSIKKMLDELALKNFRKFHKNRALAKSYWFKIYKNIYKKKLHLDKDTIFIKYEDLVNDPVTITKTLFSFIGSSQKEGVDSYNKPQDYKWKWFYDDGGEKIKTLKVQKNNNKHDDKKLLKIINTSKKISRMRKLLGYL